MATSADRKQGIVRHLELVRVERTPEQLLDLEYAESFSALSSDRTTTKRRRRPRAWYAIAEGERHPGRAFARRVCEAKQHDISREEILAALVGPLRRYVNRKYGRKAEDLDLAS